MSNERTLLGIEGAPTTKTSPVGIVILVIIIILGVVAVYYYSPGLYKGFKAQENNPPTADFIYSPESPVTASPVQFTDKSTDKDGYIVNHTWNFGDGNTTNETSPMHQYVNPGTYTVNLTVTDNDGAADSKVVSITVLTYYYFEENDKIEGSSSNQTLKSKEKSFDVYENAKYLNITVSYTIEQSPSPPNPLAKNSELDVYLYYSAENDSAASDTSEGLEKTKTISLDAQQISDHGYGKWTVLLHHYSDSPTTANTATYTLTIEVVYE
jgi:PKD repeat protein